MKRRLTIAASTGLAITTLVAPSAEAGGFKAGWQGRVESNPQTLVGFDVVKKNGKTKVTRMLFMMQYSCAGSGPVIAGFSRGSLKVDRKTKRFSGTLPFDPVLRGGPPVGRYKVSGRLIGQGRARGTVDARLDFSSARGPKTLRCYTGGLDWAANKGAELPFPFRVEGAAIGRSRP